VRRFRGWRRAAGILAAGVAAFGGAMLGGRATRSGRAGGGADAEGTEPATRAEGQAADAPSGQGGEGQEQEQPPRPGGRTAAEWTTLAVSIVVVGALVGAAVFEYFGRAEATGAQVHVELAVDEAERRGDHYYVPYTVVNVGGEPAEGVVVVFEVEQGAEVVEESTAEIAFLPNRGRAEGEMVTALDPAAHDLSARVATLQSP